MSSTHHAMGVYGHAGLSMQLPLVPGIQVQVSMAPSCAHPAHTHLHRLDSTQAPALHLAQQAQHADGEQQQCGMHAEGQHNRQQGHEEGHEEDAHTRLLKYSGQLC